MHDASPTELADAFLVPFGTSSTRPAIYLFWTMLREVLAEYVTIQEQWINGSFTTAKLDPDDIDLITIVDGAEVAALPQHHQALVGSLLAGKKTKPYWHCDSFVVVTAPPAAPGDPLPHQPALDYWHNWWSHDRAGQEKGYVRVA